MPSWPSNYQALAEIARWSFEYVTSADHRRSDAHIRVFSRARALARGARHDWTLDRALARDPPGHRVAARRAPDDGRRRRRDRRSHDPHRRAVARGLRLVQLPRLRSRPRDHRRDPRLPGRLGHAPELVAAARQPRPLRADRGALDRAARLRGLAGAAHDHAHPRVGDPGARGLRHDLPRRARSQDDVRRLPGRARARRRRAPLPLRGSRAPRRAARAPSATARGSSAWTASTA